VGQPKLYARLGKVVLAIITSSQRMGVDPAPSVCAPAGGHKNLIEELCLVMERRESKPSGHWPLRVETRVPHPKSSRRVKSVPPAGTQNRLVALTLTHPPKKW
jgi:hypothetical protein